MASMGITIVYERRSAEFRPEYRDHGFAGSAFGDVVPCKVHGAFQFSDGDEKYPVFLIEFEDGNCTMINIESIRFIKEEDEC